MKRLGIAVLGLTAILGTGLFAGEAAVHAAQRATKQEVKQEVKKEAKKEVKKEVKKGNPDELDQIVCGYFQTYFNTVLTKENITGKEVYSEDFKGDPITPYVVVTLSDDSSQYTAILNEDGGLRCLKAIDNKAASTTVSADDPYFKEKMAYDMEKIKLPSLGKCRELALDFVANHHLADDAELTYVGEIASDMLYSTVLYQYDENTILFVTISSQYNKVIGFGYRNDIDQAKIECKAADYRKSGAIG